jgi:hypothetical protein
VTSEQTEVSLRKQADAESARSGRAQRGVEVPALGSAAAIRSNDMPKLVASEPGMNHPVVLAFIDELQSRIAELYQGPICERCPERECDFCELRGCLALLSRYSRAA